MKKIELQDILENTTDLTAQKKVGYVAIVGRPNTGKSTFINALLGEKVSITTHIPQTTRKRVLAVYNDLQSQIVFFDTPGIHESQKEFNQKINDVAISSLQEADVILYFIDSSRHRGAEESYVQDLITGLSVPVISVYTKSDLPLKINIPENSYQISSTQKVGFNALLETIRSYLPEGNILYPENVYTQQDMRFRISEIIREKVFLHTKQELPHATFVGVEEIEDTPKILKIVAYVYVDTDSQKYIVIGKGGSLITQIGKDARIDLEHIFEKKVFLALRVKVMKNWRKDERLTKKLLQ